MKKALLTVFIALCLVFNIHAQEMVVYDSICPGVFAVKEYSNNELVSLNVVFVAQNDHSVIFSDPITIYSGDPIGFDKFIKDVRKFIENNKPIVSVILENGNVVMIKTDKVYIYAWDGRGYISGEQKTMISVFKLMDQKFTEWHSKNI